MRLELFRSICMRYFVFPMTLFLTVGLSACASTPKTGVTREAPETKTQASADLKAWEEGLQAFKGQEYHKAMQIFEPLSGNAENSDLRTRALYALACTRLALADSPDELESALALWESWNRQPSSGENGEDPRMLTPFLQRAARLSASRSGSSKALNPEEKVVYKDSSHSKDMTNCNNLLQARDKELERMRSKLLAKEKEVRHLRSQIDSLEAIHLKIQEKKKEISSP